MKKTQQPIKKIDITSLKVVKKENLNTLYGGNAPATWSSLAMDIDNGSDGRCSIYYDVDLPS